MKCTRKRKQRLLLLLEIVLYLICVSLLVQIFVISPTFDQEFTRQVKKKIVITSKIDKNSTQWKNWISNECSDKCGVQLFKYYFFNITNPQEVLAGELPLLQEIGPFVFERKFTKTNIKFTKSDTIVTYKYVFRFHYRHDLSGNCSYLYNRSLYQQHMQNVTGETNHTYPQIYILDPFVLSLLNSWRAQADGHVLSTTLMQLFIHDGMDLFTQNITIEQLLYTSFRPPATLRVLCDRGNPLCTQTTKYINDKPIYTSEYTGKGHFRNIRKLIKFNFDYDNTTQDIADYPRTKPWLHRIFVNGSRESIQFPVDNYIKPKQSLLIWAIDKIRPVNITSTKETYRFYSLDLLKFTISDSVYYNSDHHAANKIFYQDFQCDGLLNMTASTPTAFVLTYASKPYFLDAPCYVDNISVPMGLRQPDRDIDDTFFGVDTLLGVFFKNYLQYQINFPIFPFVTENPHPFNSLPNTIIPTFYVTVDAFAPEKSVQDYKKFLQHIRTITQISIYGGPAVAAVSFIIACWLTIRRCKRKQSILKRTMSLFVANYASVGTRLIGENEPTTFVKLKSAKIGENDYVEFSDKERITAAADLNSNTRDQAGYIATSKKERGESGGSELAILQKDTSGKTYSAIDTAA